MSESPLGFHVASSSYIEHASIPNYNCNVISSKGVNSVKCCLVLLVTISQLNNDNKSWLETQRFADCTRSPTEFLSLVVLVSKTVLVFIYFCKFLEISG